MAQLSPDLFGHLYRKALLLVEQTGAHRDDADALVASAELELAEAETAAAAIADANAAELRHLLRGHVERSAARADRARRLGAGAREQHGAACRVLAALQAESPPAYGDTRAVPVVDDHLDIREFLARVRVIAFTSDPALDAPSVQTLFSAVLQKPAAPAVLLATVQRVAGL